MTLRHTLLALSLVACHKTSSPTSDVTPTVSAPAPSSHGLLRDPHRFDCAVDRDCTNSCAYGAVSAAWYARAEQAPGFSECEDGCANQVTAPARCEQGGCVAYQRDPRAPYQESPRPQCTRVAK